MYLNQQFLIKAAVLLVHFDLHHSIRAISTKLCHRELTSQAKFQFPNVGPCKPMPSGISMENPLEFEEPKKIQQFCAKAKLDQARKFPISNLENMTISPKNNPTTVSHVR